MLLEKRVLSLPMVTVPCDHCTAACCTYIALPLDKPTVPRDFDDIRWYLMHEGVQVFVEEGDWYIQFRTRCKNLQHDNRCGIYDTRPKICKEYKAGDCDYASGDYGYDHLFTHPDQMTEFARDFARKKRAKSRSKRAKGRAHRNGQTTNGRSTHAKPRARPGGVGLNGR